MQGLNENQVKINREKHGSNSLTPSKKDTFLKKLLITLSDPIIKILLIALAIKTVFLFSSFDWYETIGIVIAIALASLISTISEYGSEKAFEKLQEEASRIKCKVIREGKKQEIPVEEVVVEDIIYLEQGDKIPADGIIVKGKISVDESSINGETKEVHKESCLNINNPKEKNRVFKGTVVYDNTAYMQVTQIGDNTFYGKIAQELQEKQPETPLKKRLRSLATFISKIGYIGSVLVFISYMFSTIVIKNHFDINLIKDTITNFPVLTGHILYALTLCVTIIIVAVPEGLPMMITLVLSSNMKRMLKNNVLVRNLIGIETSGNINILFSDKTGTLTNGKLEVISFINGEGKTIKKEKDLNKLHSIVSKSCIINNASSYSNKNIIGGNITDRAILKFFKPQEFNKKIINTIPFNSKLKYSITTIEENGKLNLIKGAPEILLKHCTTYYVNESKTYSLNKLKIERIINENASKGIRIILLATSKNKTPTNFHNLTLVGLLLIKDEVRKEAIEGVNLVRNAHIQTVMITGDNKDTALSIAKETGIYEEGKLVLESNELNNLTDDQLKEQLSKICVIARALPSDKSRLVRISQELDLVVGMTGDGVNDAPALKKADVGFSMGSGTEVSKEASDIVILDDNFLSISKAILFGRTIFKSIRKFIILQLTINMCALSLSIIGPFIGIEMPITVIQMLWINMVMDTLAGVAFSFEPALKEYMNELPKTKDESIINRYMINEILITGIYSSVLCILFLKLPIFHHIYHANSSNKYLYTAFFGLFIFIDIFNSFNARTHRVNLLANILKNKMFIIIISFIAIIQIILIYFGGNLFRTSGLSLIEFEIMIILAFTVIPIDWIRKLYLRKKGLKDGV